MPPAETHFCAEAVSEPGSSSKWMADSASGLPAGEQTGSAVAQALVDEVGERVRDHGDRHQGGAVDRLREAHGCLPQPSTSRTIDQRGCCTRVASPRIQWVRAASRRPLARWESMKVSIMFNISGSPRGTA